eukprot:jgi/Botrbrau1/4613/Bobra.60_2s0096.2
MGRKVEMAQLEYQASRLVRGVSAAAGLRAGFGDASATEVVSARERGRSGSSSGGLGGAGGGGETELQLQRSRIRARLKLLRQRLEEVKKTRRVQREGRRKSGRPVVAVVGYTNAGKSSLVTALSGQHVSARDRLFETLDPTLRRVHLPSGASVLVSDTVGFISGLPTQLVRAFRATLEEVTHADLLLHVLDASSPQVVAQRKVVLDVLRDLGIPDHVLQERLIEVWNKVDLLQEAPRKTAEGVTSPAAAAAQVTASELADFESGWEWSLPAALPPLDPSPPSSLEKEANRFIREDLWLGNTMEHAVPDLVSELPSPGARVGSAGYPQGSQGNTPGGPRDGSIWDPQGSLVGGQGSGRVGGAESPQGSWDQTEVLRVGQSPQPQNHSRVDVDRPPARGLLQKLPEVADESLETSDSTRPRVAGESGEGQTRDGGRGRARGDALGQLCPEHEAWEGGAEAGEKHSEGVKEGVATSAIAELLQGGEEAGAQRVGGGPIRVLTSVKTRLGLRDLAIELDRLLAKTGLRQP